MSLGRAWLKKTALFRPKGVSAVDASDVPLKGGAA
ncbi:hypothetical protein HNQ38_002720 [Desulfovibrio intestinalis]|uniref:Uncharacterized protein n=1 Tax=Desulfovibrio intestinalis TaxID=58621 RepID=A0A7W8FFA6_9BACT|nr:hypothetical protein [Desulfovibrio intestinalis]